MNHDYRSLLMLVACLYWVPGSASEEAVTAQQAIVWPPPPGDARIQYVSEFSQPEDLGLKKSFGRRIKKLLAGSDDRRMTRPYAVAGDEKWLVVADPDASAVHFFRKDRQTYELLTGIGKQPFKSPIAVSLGEDNVCIADSRLGRVFVLNTRLKLDFVIEGLQRPAGLAVSRRHQRLYVADALAHRINVYDMEGKELEPIGERGEKEGQFNFPTHLAVSGDGELLVVNDTLNFRVQIFTHDGQFKGKFGQYGLGPGFFAQSKGVAIDPDGHTYIADARMNWIQVFDQDGTFLLVFGSGGHGPGAFNMPTGMTFVDDTLYVADSLNQRVQTFRYLPK